MAHAFVDPHRAPSPVQQRRAGLTTAFNAGMAPPAPPTTAMMDKDREIAMLKARLYESERINASLHMEVAGAVI